MNNVRVNLYALNGDRHRPENKNGCIGRIIRAVHIVYDDAIVIYDYDGNKSMIPCSVIDATTTAILPDKDIMNQHELAPTAAVVVKRFAESGERSACYIVLLSNLTAIIKLRRAGEETKDCEITYLDVLTTNRIRVAGSINKHGSDIFCE